MATGVLPSGSSHDDSIKSAKAFSFMDAKYCLVDLHCGGAFGTIPGSLVLLLRGFLGVGGTSLSLSLWAWFSMMALAVMTPSLDAEMVVVATTRS